MQGLKIRSNRERSESTRRALLSAARRLFVEKGYAASSTPDIVAAAGVTRGALYHHFKDKQDLFHAVAAEEARAVADEIEAAAPKDLSACDALVAGTLAYLDAMAVPGRTRLLLIDGPAVLGSAEMQVLDDANAARTLREGLEAATAESGDTELSVAAATTLLSAAFDRASLAMEAGYDSAEIRSAMTIIIERVLHGSSTRPRLRKDSVSGAGATRRTRLAQDR